jgi:hypothetical protein
VGIKDKNKTFAYKLVIGKFEKRHTGMTQAREPLTFGTS